VAKRAAVAVRAIRDFIVEVVSNVTFIWRRADLQTVGKRRNAGRKLPEPGVRTENVDPFAVVGPKFAAFERFLAGISGRENGFISLVPLRGEKQPTLLHPAFEILGAM